MINIVNMINFIFYHLRSNADLNSLSFQLFDFHTRSSIDKNIKILLTIIYLNDDHSRIYSKIFSQYYKFHITKFHAE